MVGTLSTITSDAMAGRDMDLIFHRAMLNPVVRSGKRRTQRSLPVFPLHAPITGPPLPPTSEPWRQITCFALPSKLLDPDDDLISFR